MRQRRTRWSTLAAIVTLLLVIAACGGEEATSDAGGAAPETGGSADTAAPATTEAMEPTEDVTDTAAASPEDSGSPAAADGAVTVALADTDLGEILVDGEGRTLYLFLPDEQGPSTCYDSCAGNWPPVIGEATAGEGVDESLLGTVERDDGSMQVTYNGWPLYLFAADSAPGDINGQGVGDVWYVVDAAGEMVQDAAATATPAAAGGGDDDEDY